MLNISSKRIRAFKDFIHQQKFSIFKIIFVQDGENKIFAELKEFKYFRFKDEGFANLISEQSGNKKTVKVQGRKTNVD